MSLFEKVPGENKSHKLKLFAISTCPWCKKTKKLLDELNAEYEYVYIDKLEKKDKKKILEKLEEHNSSKNVPTLVIDEKETIIGFKEDKIREVL